MIFPDEFFTSYNSLDIDGQILIGTCLALRYTNMCYCFENSPRRRFVRRKQERVFETSEYDDARHNILEIERTIKLRQSSISQQSLSTRRTL